MKGRRRGGEGCRYLCIVFVLLIQNLGLVSGTAMNLFDSTHEADLFLVGLGDRERAEEGRCSGPLSHSSLSRSSHSLASK